MLKGYSVIRVGNTGLLLGLFTAVWSSSVCAGFSPTNDGDDLVVVNEKDARFYFGISPWPPPCPPCDPYKPELMVYEYVTVQFWNLTHGDGQMLCEVDYVNGTHDSNSTKSTCSERTDNRTLDFDPDLVANGVLFVVRRALVMDRGEYAVKLNYGRPVVRATRQLVIHKAPSGAIITSDVNGLEQEVGQVVTLTCKVSGAWPAASLRWTRGMTQDIPPIPGDNCKVATSIDDFSECRVKWQLSRMDHSVAFVCWTENYLNHGEPTSNSITYYIRHNVVRVEPCSQPDIKYHVVRGRPAKLTCQVSAYPAWEQLHWYQGDDSDRPDQSTEIISAFNQTTHTIGLVDQDLHNAVFFCKAINENVASRVEFCQIDVQYGVNITIDEREREVVEGDDIRIMCTSDANPPANVFLWRKAENASWNVDEAEFEVVNARPEDAGVYTCSASNRLTPTGSQSQEYTDTEAVQLHVLYSPKWKDYALKKWAAPEGASGNVVCQVTGYPSISFRWRRDGVPINPSSKYRIEYDGDRSTLTVGGITSADYVTFTCVTFNTQGESSHFIELLRPGLPDPPQACRVHNTSDSCVHLLCLPGYDGGHQLTFTVTSSPSSSTKTSSYLLAAHGWVGVLVENLRSNMEYKLHVFGQNKYGRSQQSYSLQTKTTGDGAVEPPSGPSGVGPSVGTIVGATVGVFILLTLLVAGGMLLYWRQDTAEKDQTDSQADGAILRESFTGGHDAQRNSIGLRYAGNELLTEPISEGFAKNAQVYENKAFDETEVEVHRPGNEYVMHPGMTRSTQAPGQPEVRESDVRPGRQGVRLRVDLEQGDERYKSSIARHNAVNPSQRANCQSNLAGMGALSSMSSAQKLAEHCPTLSDGTRSTTFTSPGTMTTHPPLPPHPKPDEWEIRHQDIELSQKLGEGSFGEIWCAMIDNAQKGYVLVAVKMIRGRCPIEEQDAFNQELKVMKSLQPHPNIITLHGCCTQNEPSMIVMEYATKGNLQLFLRDNRADFPHHGRNAMSQTLTTHDLASFAVQVANGMAYISSNDLLHRDLAARNILISNDNLCKISDFGLARDIINCREYESKTKRRLPLRWMSPESLFDNIFSSKSDVWSFGVLLWEIVTLGSSPYPGMAGCVVMEMIEQGFRMDKPKHCSDAMYAMMADCWRHTPEQRPSFGQLHGRLKDIVHDLTIDPYANMQVNQMHENMFKILHNLPGEKC